MDGSIIVLSFYIYSLIGWLWESILLPYARNERFINSGFLNGPVIPIYGFGAIFIYLILLNEIKYPIHIVFITSGVIACVLEYITSYGLEKIYHRRWWDYSSRPFNINGRISLEGFLCFGLFGCLVIYFIQPYFNQFLLGFSHTSRIIVASVFTTLFLSDLFTTIISTLHLEETIVQFQKILEEESEKYYSKQRKRRHMVRTIINDKLSKSLAVQEFNKNSKYIEKRLLKAFPFLTKK